MRCRKMLLMLLFMIMPLFALADPGEPCGGEDPYDEQCPLDSWVYMLTLTPVTIAFVGIFLRNEALKEEAKRKNDNKNLPANQSSNSIHKHKKAA